MKKILLIVIALVLLIALYAGISYAMHSDITIGWKNSQRVVYRYYCSDVCPQNGRWFTTYYPIPSRDECVSLGGEVIIDPAFRAYIGCTPR